MRAHVLDGSSPTTDRPIKLPALTTLRFVAAAGIVLYHTYLPFGVGRRVAESIQLEQAVSFFFVLSGFILTLAYPTLRGADAPRFYLARFARVWPAHFATFLLVFVLFQPPDRTPGPADPRWAALLNLGLLHAWSVQPGYYFSYNGPSWTLSTEFAFYLLFPVLVRNLGQTWPWKLAGAFGLLAGVVAYCNHHAVPAHYVMVYVNPMARLLEFVLGMATALVWERCRSRARPPRAAGTGFEVAAVGLVAWTMYNSHAWAVIAGRHPLVGPAGAVWLVQGGIPALFFGVLILVMALGMGSLSRALSAPLLVALGEMSFAVYLIHHPMVRWYTLHSAWLPALSPWLAYLAFWGVLLGASYLCWTLVEQPSRRTLVRLGRSRSE